MSENIVAQPKNSHKKSVKARENQRIYILNSLLLVGASMLPITLLFAFDQVAPDLIMGMWNRCFT